MGLKSKLPKKMKCRDCGALRRTKWEILGPNRDAAAGMTRCANCETVSFHTFGNEEFVTQARELLVQTMGDDPIHEQRCTRSRRLDD